MDFTVKFCIGWMVAAVTYELYFMSIGFYYFADSRLESISRSDCELTDAYVELTNLIAFVELSSACITEEGGRSLLSYEIVTDVDREALNTLENLGFSSVQAQFICNYFLAQNLKYPGNIIVLSSQTPSYISDYYPPIPKLIIRLQIQALFRRKYHGMIVEKETVYFFK